MVPRSLLTTVALLSLSLAGSAAGAKKVKPAAKPAEPPHEAWSGVWHTAATVSYSSCPGTEPGHQEAFTLTIVASEKAIAASELPEQSLTRKFVGNAEQRGKQWILELRDKDGKNGMDLWLDDDGKKLVGTRVLVRSARKGLCSVVYSVEGSLDEA